MKFNTVLPYLIYLLLNFITYIMVRETSDDFNIRYSFSYILNAILSLLCISSTVLLIKTKQDPGKLQINRKGILEREITLSDSTIKLKYTPLMIMKLMPCNGCKFCKIMELPLRSVHCTKCQRCIRTYDHHSNLIGCCIGENNHFAFVLFLFTQSITFKVGIIGLIKRYYIQKPFAKIAQDYVKKRKLNANTLEKFKLGYSGEYDELYKLLKSKGYNEKEILETGLVKKSEKGSYYDFYRKRLENGI